MKRLATNKGRRTAMTTENRTLKNRKLTKVFGFSVSWRKFIALGGTNLLGIIAHFFSIPCPACKKTAAVNNSEFCPDCIEKLNIINPPFCPGCGGKLDGILDVCSKCLKEEAAPWISAIALIHMKGPGRKLVQRFKYKNDISLARPFAALAVNALEISNIHFDIISSVPLHWSRKFSRGYNQSTLLARRISSIIKVKYKKTLYRNKHTRSQARLSGKERRKNMNNAFSVMDNRLLKDKSILLVDDVFTTGSTLRAASKELLKAKAKNVSILVLARR